VLVPSGVSTWASTAFCTAAIRGAIAGSGGTQVAGVGQIGCTWLEVAPRSSTQRPCWRTSASLTMPRSLPKKPPITAGTPRTKPRSASTPGMPA
jgi:hypothetical protein